MNFDDTTFTNGEIKVSYDPKKCKNSRICCAGLPEVFRDSVIPWIDLNEATSEAVVQQIKKCPSGALSYLKLNELSGVS